jgi:hypothetical protein
MPIGNACQILPHHGGAEHPQVGICPALQQQGDHPNFPVLARGHEGRGALVILDVKIGPCV